MPTLILDMQQRCREVSGRCSPDVSIHASDDDCGNIPNNVCIIFLLSDKISNLTCKLNDIDSDDEDSLGSVAHCM